MSGGAWSAAIVRAARPNKGRLRCNALSMPESRVFARSGDFSGTSAHMRSGGTGWLIVMTVLRRETGLCRLCEPVAPECGRALAVRRLRSADVEAVKRAAAQFERDRYARRLPDLYIAQRTIALTIEHKAQSISRRQHRRIGRQRWPRNRR